MPHNLPRRNAFRPLGAGGTDFAPAVFTVWPVCANGFVLLGDLSKYVALSAQRFSQVECTATGVSATVVGSIGEVRKTPSSFYQDRLGTNIGKVEKKGVFRRR